MRKCKSVSNSRNLTSVPFIKKSFYNDVTRLINKFIKLLIVFNLTDISNTNKPLRQIFWKTNISYPLIHTRTYAD